MQENGKSGSNHVIVQCSRYKAIAQRRWDLEGYGCFLFCISNIEIAETLLTSGSLTKDHKRTQYIFRDQHLVHSTRCDNTKKTKVSDTCPKLLYGEC